MIKGQTIKKWSNYKLTLMFRIAFDKCLIVSPSQCNDRKKMLEPATSSSLGRPGSHAHALPLQCCRKASPDPYDLKLEGLTNETLERWQLTNHRPGFK